MSAASGILDLGCVVAIQVASPPLSALDLALKRAFDLAAAIAGLLVLSPLFLMVAAIIKLDSPGPGFLFASYATATITGRSGCISSDR